MEKIKVGLYGTNGHQINQNISFLGLIDIIAVCEIQKSRINSGLTSGNIIKYATLHEMIKNPDINLIVLASPIRANQKNDTIACLNAKKHVYVEKPCAFSIADLDKILDCARANNVLFREMCETIYEQPYATAAEIVSQGIIGEVVQVFAQKSYPYHDNRPQDDETDGGIIRWIGVHGMRFIEHISGEKIIKITHSAATQLGNPKKGQLEMAAHITGTLENGGLATLIMNYLKPQQQNDAWGNEHVRIFGTKGMIEITDGGTRRRLITHDKDYGEFDLIESFIYERELIKYYRGEKCGLRPLSIDLHPTRSVIIAKDMSTEIKLGDRE